MLWHRYPLQDRPNMATRRRAQGEVSVGIEFINYAQARQLEVSKGQGADASSVAIYSDFSLTVKIHGVRGLLNNLRSGVRRGVYVESRSELSHSCFQCVGAVVPSSVCFCCIQQPSFSQSVQLRTLYHTWKSVMYHIGKALSEHDLEFACDSTAEEISCSVRSLKAGRSWSTACCSLRAKKGS